MERPPFTAGFQFAISGRIGSGTSTTAECLVDSFNAICHPGTWILYSASSIFRQWAIEEYPQLGPDSAATEFAKKAKSDPTIDQRVDEELQHVGRNQTHVVVDCRLARFLPNAFRVYMDCDENTAAKRVVDRAARRGQSMTFEDALRKNSERNAFDLERYQRAYGIKTFKDQFPDPSEKWDLCFDTSEGPGIVTPSTADIVREIGNKWTTWVHNKFPS